MELSFCEVCGKKIPLGQKYCDKHAGSKETEKEFSDEKDNDKDDDDKDEDERDPGEVFGLL